MDTEIDDKYEFSAPKFIDFTKAEQDEDYDKWFDEREGDEGGIDIDLAPYYEEAMGDNGFKHATAAISAALTNDSGSPEPKTNTIDETKEAEETSYKLTKQERKSHMPPVTNDGKQSENEVTTLKRIKQERMSHMPEVSTEEESDESTIKKIKQERMSHMPQQIAQVTTDSESEMHVDKPAPPRKSNIRTSWESPAPKTRVLRKSTNRSRSIKQERMSHMPEVSTEEESDESTIRKIKQERMSHMPQQRAQDTRDSESEMHVHKTAPARKSNIRTSWRSPSPGPTGYRSEPSPVIKRNQPLRKSTNRPINYSDTKKRKGASISDCEPVIQKKSKTSETSFSTKLRERGLKRGMSSEEATLNKMRELQQRTRTNMKRNARSSKMALRGQLLPNKVVSILPVTKAKEFHFATDDRLKEQPLVTTQGEQAKPFEQQLRKHQSPYKFHKEPTKTKPFNFHGGDKPSSKPEQKWVSMAQRTAQFQTKTPERFRMKPKEVANVDNDKKQPSMTIPQTPNLTTKTRSRPVTAISAKEQEEKEAQEMKSYQFKATRFDRAIVEKQGMYGVKQMPQTHTTAARPFHFQSDSRMNLRKHKLDDSGNESNTSTSSANTSTKTGGDHKLKKTEVKPFSFETRDKKRYMQKEEKIKKILEEEDKLREFEAQPVPSFSPEALPLVQRKSVTNPQPFAISKGSIQYQQKLKEKLQREEEENKRKRAFKAHEATVTSKEPFKPVQGLIPPTNPQEVISNLEVRAKERSKFEEWKHEKESQLEEHKARILKEQEIEELKEIKQLRKDAVPKSYPIRQYKPLIVEKDLIPVTDPITPNFRTTKRAMLRN